MVEEVALVIMVVEEEQVPLQATLVEVVVVEVHLTPLESIT